MKNGSKMMLVAALPLVAVATSATANLIYSTPFVPGTPPGPGEVIASYSAVINADSPQFRRPTSAGSELAPVPPTTLAGTASSLYRYHVAEFTPETSGVYDFYSAQAFDGFLHLYLNPFDPALPLTNVLAGDDDMTMLNGGTVPNRNGVAGTADSGFRLSLVGGTTYQIVTSTFSAGSIPANGAIYNEVRRPNLGTPATPIFAIADGTAVGPGVPTTIDLVITDPGTIVGFNSLTLTNISHTFLGDLVVTLTHVESGITVDILDRVGRTTGTGFGSGLDLAGNYVFVDGGAAIPSTGTVLAPGEYGLSPNGEFGSSAGLGSLDAFVGVPLAGTWRLSVQDFASGDVGSISAFSINVVIPEPAALGLLAPVAVLALRRRRA